MFFKDQISKFLSLSAFLFAISFFYLSEFPLKKQNQKPVYFAPPEIITHFSLGFSDLYADLLWMRLIQDIDFCGSQKGIPIYDGSKKYHCEKGWSFKMAEAITELAPRFLTVYQMSGSIMSIIMGDKQGAKQIYDKALKYFPNHWKIHFSAGYHYLLELKEEEKAAKLLIRSADLGGPYWLYALAAQTYSKLGKLLLSKEILLEAIKKDITGKYKSPLEFRLKQVEEEIEKSKNAFQPKTPFQR